MKIDIAIPTYGGEETIETCLNSLERSVSNTLLEVNRILIDCKPKGGETPQIVREWAEGKDVDVDIEETDHNLPQARNALTDRVETEWFLFVDDDVYLRGDTLKRLWSAKSPAVGAVQSRKQRQDGDNAGWSKWRPVRATYFTTLVRTRAVSDLSIPSDVTVLEEEYTRQHIENEHGYLWVFNHQAVIDHDNQGRHSIDYDEGYIAGKYGLLPYWYVYMNIPYNIATLNHPLRHAARGVGYAVGKVSAWK